MMVRTSRRGSAEQPGERGHVGIRSVVGLEQADEHQVVAEVRARLGEIPLLHGGVEFPHHFARGHHASTLPALIARPSPRSAAACRSRAAT
jgi:hypothetical protein